MKPARPYIYRFRVFNRLIWPSTGPLLSVSFKVFCTAGCQGEIHTARDRKLEKARHQRRIRQQQAAQDLVSDSVVKSNDANSNQVVVLDGNSITLASNRTLVAKVQNARGAAGSPIVLVSDLWLITSSGILWRSAMLPLTPQVALSGLGMTEMPIVPIRPPASAGSSMLPSPPIRER
jgi:hypothetical protein